MKKDYTLVKSIFRNDINITKAVAYCPYHKGYLTVQQMKAVKCVKRNCQYLEKTDHPYWEYEEKKKRDKERKKNERNNGKEIFKSC